MKATVSEKGQVTIPKKLRNQLGIEPGASLHFKEENGRLIVVKSEKKTYEENLRKWVGAGKLEGFENTDDYINEIRDR